MPKKFQLLKIYSCLLSVILYSFLFLYIDFRQLSDGYTITLFLPLIFIICLFIFLWDPVTKIKTPFIVFFTVVAFIRYVVLSVVTLINGTYIGISGVQPSSESLTFSGLLMIWELIIASIFISFWTKNKIPKISKEKAKITSGANIIIYVIVVLFSVALIVLIPQARSGLSIFSEVTYSNGIESITILGIRELFINAKYFLLFIIIILIQKHRKNKMGSYSWVLLTSILIIGIRIGTNRKQLISDSLAVLLTLWRVFPKYKRLTAIVISSIGTLLVAVTTLFRGMTDSLNSFFTEYFDIDFLQPYFLGQYNIAISVEAVNLYSYMIDYKTYFLGFIRPIIGIGSIIGDINFNMVQNLFDLRMSLGLSGFRGDQILPMIGEGYMLFGFILSPLFLVLTIRLGILFDSIYTRSRNLELVFISSIISFYLAQAMILNSTIILNMLSFRLAIYIPIVWLAYIFNNKKKADN